MTRAHRMLAGDTGMTLAEILVATAIISIGLVGLAVVIPLASYGLHEGSSLSTATFLAEQRMEEIRNAAWTSIPSDNDCLGIGSSAAPTSSTCTRSQPTSCSSGTACTTYADESSVSGYAAYSRTVRVTDCDTTACAGVTDDDMRLVRVTVTYRPMTGTGGVASGGKSAILELVVAKRE